MKDRRVVTLPGLAVRRIVHAEVSRAQMRTGNDNIEGNDCVLENAARLSRSSPRECGEEVMPEVVRLIDWVPGLDQPEHARHIGPGSRRVLCV